MKILEFTTLQNANSSDWAGSIFHFPDKDRQAIHRESFNDVSKTDRGTAMPHARMSRIRIQKPAETVRHRFAWREIIATRLRGPMRLAAVGKLHWSERGLHLCRGEKRVLSQSLIPLGEVLKI